MKASLGYFSLAIVLLAVGWIFWTTARIERRVVEADSRLVTLRDGSDLTKNTAQNHTSWLIGLLPWVRNLDVKMREQQTTSKYWLSDYKLIGLQRDSNGEPTETNPRILLESANAAYRTVKRTMGDPTVIRQLESVMGIYAEVLKRDPNSFDAAYNYEFVARVRDSLSHPPPAKAGEKSQPKSAATSMPPKQTIHGNQGAPPDASDTSPFKLLVPKQGDERKEDPEAGKGEKKIRKG